MGRAQGAMDKLLETARNTPHTLYDGTLFLTMLHTLKAQTNQAQEKHHQLHTPHQKITCVINALKPHLPNPLKQPNAALKIQNGDVNLATMLAVSIQRLAQSSKPSKTPNQQTDTPRHQARNRKFFQPRKHHVSSLGDEDAYGHHRCPFQNVPANSNNISVGQLSHKERKNRMRRGTCAPTKFDIVSWLIQIGQETLVREAEPLVDLSVETLPDAFASGTLLCALTDALCLRDGEVVTTLGEEEYTGHSTFSLRCARFSAALQQLQLPRLNSDVSRSLALKGADEFFIRNATKMASGGSIWPLLREIYMCYAVSSSLKTNDASKKSESVAEASEAEATASQLAIARDSEAAAMAAFAATKLISGHGSWNHPQGRNSVIRWLYFGHNIIAIDVDHLAPFCSAPHVLDDPLTNGLLLFELACSLTARQSQVGISFPTPRVPAHARVNLMDAIALLRFANMPSKSLDEAEVDIASTIKGMRDGVWKILWEAMLAHPTVEPPARYIECGGAAMRERGLLVWMRNLILHPPQITSEPEQSQGESVKHGAQESMPINVPSIEEIVPVVITGELLCDVSQRLTGIPLHGIFRPPRTQVSALQNLRKAVKHLRDLNFRSSFCLALPEPESKWETKLAVGERIAILDFLSSARRIHKLVKQTAV